MLQFIHHRLRDWLFTQADIQRLRAIDDRLLADMGLDRTTMARRVRGRSR